MKNLKLLLSLMVLFFTFYSCDKQDKILMPQSIESESIIIDYSKQIKLDPTILTKTVIDELSCGEMVVDLIAGQHINVGTVTVQSDETNLYVTYEVTGNWYLAETHLYVGPENEIPYNGGGNPKIGHFPYHGDHVSTQSYTFTIPLTNLDECFAVIAHAVVNEMVNGRGVSSETAFGCGDKEFTGNRWGCYFEYCREECEEECIEASTYKFPHTNNPDFIWSNCFFDEGFDNWGWSTGPFDYENYTRTIPIKIDSNTNDDDCTPNNDTIIGNVTFTLDTATNEVIVNIVIDDTNYKMTDSYVYIGEDKFPLDNGNPTSDTAFYGNEHESLDYVSTDSYTIGGIETSFYIIVKVNVCRFYN